MTNKTFKKRVKEEIANCKVKARIEQDHTGRGYWLLIDQGDMKGNIACALCEKEIRPIMEACARWLIEHDDKLRVSEV